MLDRVWFITHNNRVSTIVFGGFEWDATKAETNLQKHGVSFVEAASVFGDPNAYYVDNLSPEGRIAVLGFSSHARLLVVVHAEVEGDRLRIISARRASRAESLRY